MGQVRLFFYRTILVLFLFHFYTIIEALSLDTSTDISERGLVTQLVGVINMPINLVLALLRLWTLRPIRHRNILFESTYFAIPILTAILCFGELIWGGIILTFIAAILILCEFGLNVLKKKFILAQDTQSPDTIISD